MNYIGYRIYLIPGKRGWLAVNHRIKHLFINHLPTFLYLNMISVCVSWGILQVFRFHSLPLELNLQLIKISFNKRLHKSPISKSRIMTTKNLKSLWVIFCLLSPILIQRYLESIISITSEMGWSWCSTMTNRAHWQPIKNMDSKQVWKWFQILYQSETQTSVKGVQLYM